MEALNRKPDVMTVKKSMELSDGTRIDVIGITARKVREIANIKGISQFDKGVLLTAAKIRVNGQPVVLEDMLDGFYDYELNEILEFVNGTEEKVSQEAEREKSVDDEIPND